MAIPKKSKESPDFTKFQNTFTKEILNHFKSQCCVHKILWTQHCEMKMSANRLRTKKQLPELFTDI